MFRIVSKGAILTSLIVAPNAGWSQNMPSQVQVSPAPMRESEAVSKDDRSYLPPSMRGEYVATNATMPVAVQRVDKPTGSAKSARRHKKRGRHYAQVYGFGFGFFNP